MKVKLKSRLERNRLGSVSIWNRIVTVTDQGLERIVTVTDQGLEHEADQARTEILMKDMHIDESSKKVVTPGVVSTSEGGKFTKEKLGNMEEKVYLER